MAPTVQELYELWADDAELKDVLAQSLAPRGVDSLFDTFATLGPAPGGLLLDVGARDASYAIRLVKEHGLRAVALDPVPLHVELARDAVAEAGLTDAIEVVEAAMESMPLPDHSADWIWCRDVLVHVDARRGLAECARVLKPGGTLLAYVTLATDRLEPRERAELVDTMAIETFDADEVEGAARDAGLVLRSIDVLGSEWRERMIEDDTWQAAEALLAIARLGRGDYVERYGETVVAAARSGLLWGIYQMVGKLCPTIYVWTSSD